MAASLFRRDGGGQVLRPLLSHIPRLRATGSGGVGDPDHGDATMVHSGRTAPLLPSQLPRRGGLAGRS
eukprot:2536231-Pleurochrysis_carterae.AAC.1